MCVRSGFVLARKTNLHRQHLSRLDVRDVRADPHATVVVRLDAHGESVCTQIRHLTAVQSCNTHVTRKLALLIVSGSHLFVKKTSVLSIVTSNSVILLLHGSGSGSPLPFEPAADGTSIDSDSRGEP